MMREQALNRHQNQNVSSRNRKDGKTKKQKLRSIPLELKLSREKNAKKDHSESEQKYDVRVGLHAEDDTELIGSLNNILETIKKSEDEHFGSKERYSELLRRTPQKPLS